MSWDRVRGHDAILAGFRAALDRGRLGHAYLFVGPDGVGKKLFATELARALLCEAPPAALAACDRCPACRQIDADSPPDFLPARRPDDRLELPIEVVRDLGARLSLKPMRGGRKVAVLEDADDFNEESANA